MFVRQSRYDALMRHAAEAVAAHGRLLREWNALVKRINAKGGEALFDAPRFTPEEIDRLIRLCHPDKHNGSTAATEMTAKLLAMRDRAP